MWIDRHLFATCSSGLCNRLLVLAGSIRVAQRTGRRLALYWPVNADLGCRFNDLFTNQFEMVDESTLASILDTTVTVKIYNAWKTQGPIYRKISADGDPDDQLVIVKGWSYPMFETEGYSRQLDEELQAILNSFVPNSEISGYVDAFVFPAPAVGVHVRRGDHVEEFGQSKDEHFFRIMQAMLARAPGLKFFFATDCATTESRFRQEFGSVLLSSPKTWARRDQLRGVREGLVDLLLLSRTAAIIGTVHSSFSQTAGRMGGKRMIVADEISSAASLAQSCELLSGALDGARVRQ